MLNKVLPAYLLEPGAGRVAERLRADGAALAAELGSDAGEPAAVTRVLREAAFFIEALDRLGLHPGALVLNKVLPTYLLDPGATRVAEGLRSDGPALAAELGAEAGDPSSVARVLREVGESFLNFGVVAKREAEQRAELEVRPDVLVAVPFFDTDIYDLAGLLRLGRTLWSDR